MTDALDIEIGRYALRTFRPDYKKRELRSVAWAGSHWLHGTCEARCLGFGSPGFTLTFPFEPVHPVRHTAPDENCSCGIYGTLNLADLIQFNPVYTQKIIAVFAAEGRTIIGDIGLKTQYARVVAYWSPIPDIRKISQNQFEGAKRFDDLSTMLTTYGFPDEIPFKIKKRRIASTVAMTWFFACLVMTGLDAQVCYFNIIHHQYALMGTELSLIGAMLYCVRINYKNWRRS